MYRGWAALLLLTVSWAQSSPEPARSKPAGGISIPAELTTTVRAESARRGDPIVFKSLEAVLLSNGLVMPADAKLLGRIVGASPLQGDKPSWVVLLVERAEWKQQSVPLHAFISAQIDISRATHHDSSSGPNMQNETNVRRLGRESGRVALENGVDISSSTRLPQDSSGAAEPTSIRRSQPIKDLRVVRDKNGIAYLFCPTANLKLPSGSLFVLRDESVRDTEKNAAVNEQMPSTEVQR